MRKARPDSSAATNTPVPAAEIQLIVKTAPSGFAPGFATGGMRCTFLSRSGIANVGSESVPENFEPISVVSNFTFFIDSFAAFLKGGLPHSAQHRIRIIHGVHASIVWPTVYL